MTNFSNTPNAEVSLQSLRNLYVDRIVIHETRISVIINMVLSGVFFCLIFGLSPRDVSISRPDDLALDFILQSVIIGFLATFVPAIIISSKRRKSLIKDINTNAITSKSAFLHALGFTLMTAAVGIFIAFFLYLACEKLGYFTALLAKIVYGGLLAYLVTPRAVRLSLRGENS
jgi:hypothetical protein